MIGFQPLNHKIIIKMQKHVSDVSQQQPRRGRFFSGLFGLDLAIAHLRARTFRREVMGSPQGASGQRLGAVGALSPCRVKPCAEKWEWLKTEEISGGAQWVGLLVHMATHLWVKTQETPGEQKDRWQMDVHPPQNGAIDYTPWPFLGNSQGMDPRRSIRHCLPSGFTKGSTPYATSDHRFGTEKTNIYMIESWSETAPAKNDWPSSLPWMRTSDKTQASLEPTPKCQGKPKETSQFGFPLETSGDKCQRASGHALVCVTQSTFGHPSSTKKSA